MFTHHIPVGINVVYDVLQFCNLILHIFKKEKKKKRIEGKLRNTAAQDFWFHYTLTPAFNHIHSKEGCHLSFIIIWSSLSE